MPSASVCSASQAVFFCLLSDERRTQNIRHGNCFGGRPHGSPIDLAYCSAPPQMGKPCLRSSNHISFSRAQTLHLCPEPDGFHFRRRNTRRREPVRDVLQRWPEVPSPAVPARESGRDQGRQRHLAGGKPGLERTGLAEQRRFSVSKWRHLQPQSQPGEQSVYKREFDSVTNETNGITRWCSCCPMKPTTSASS